MVPHNAFMYQYLNTSDAGTTAERRADIKAKVLQYMEDNLDKSRDRIVLYHDNDPVLYDETGQWTFGEQTTIQEDSGEMRTNTILIAHLVKRHCCQTTYKTQKAYANKLS